MQVYITGVSGYLGGLLCRFLEDDPSIDRIVGVDLQPPKVRTSKLEYHSHDVRDPSIREAMKGSDVVLHMAFVLNEIRDKARTYDININGSKNVFHACLDTGVPWLIQLSSMAAFGPHPDNPVPLTEEDYPRGHPGCYYCYSKAELEHYLRWLSEKNPELDVTVLRPTIIIGESIDNTVAWLFQNRFAVRLKGHDSFAQYIHEDDLVRAIQIVLQKRALGTYHITSDDMMTVSEMMRRAGIPAPSMPLRALEILADIGFRFGFSPVSSHWVRMFSESMVGSSEKLKALGWVPSYSTSELFEEYIVKRVCAR
jgi:UDP-glucose 4-epimerase